MRTIREKRRYGREYYYKKKKKKKEDEKNINKDKQRTK